MWYAARCGHSTIPDIIIDYAFYTPFCLQALYPNIKCLRMMVLPAAGRLHFEYKVQMGVTTKSQYM